jgi:hypothetical protein
MLIHSQPIKLQIKRLSPFDKADLYHKSSPDTMYVSEFGICHSCAGRNLPVSFSHRFAHSNQAEDPGSETGVTRFQNYPRTMIIGCHAGVPILLFHRRDEASPVARRIITHVYACAGCQASEHGSGSIPHEHAHGYAHEHLPPALRGVHADGAGLRVYGHACG